MSRRAIYYFSLIFIITFLFYQERMGLNAIFAALSFVGFVAFDPSRSSNESDRNWKWYLAASLFLSNAFATYFIHSGFSIVLFYISLLYFIGVNYNIQLSLPLGLVQSLYSFFTGFYHIIESVLQFFRKKKESDRHRGLIRFIIILTPLIIGLIFLKLYQNADETFAEWTAFINLDWISWGFIGMYFILSYVLFGLYFFHGATEIDQTENKYKNTILSGYTDHVQQFLGLMNERKIAMSLLITLISLLLIYNVVDLRFIFVELPNPAPTIRYSDLLHGGVNSLITSIILVILIITFIFRGELNFQRNKTLKTLTLIWLTLNIIMIITTGIKNYAYISHWGLTYKRIGVYIYLILALSGIIFTFIKVLRVKSFWYLLRNTSLAFMVVFTLVGFFNWNKIIVENNLKLPISRIDFHYLNSLGDDAYPAMLVYYHTHQSELYDELDFWQRVGRNFNWSKEWLERKQDVYTWKSKNYRESQLLQEMRSINPITNKKNGYDEMDYR
jgi:hypothetical protein